MTTHTLTANDLCDRCGAPAYVRVKIPGAENDLLFCGHHYRPNARALAALAESTPGVEILDETPRLIAQEDARMADRSLQRRLGQPINAMSVARVVCNRADDPGYQPHFGGAFSCWPDRCHNRHKERPNA